MRRAADKIRVTFCGPIGHLGLGTLARPVLWRRRTTQGMKQGYVEFNVGLPPPTPYFVFWFRKKKKKKVAAPGMNLCFMYVSGEYDRIDLFKEFWIEYSQGTKSDVRFLFWSANLRVHWLLAPWIAMNSQFLGIKCVRKKVRCCYTRHEIWKVP